MKPKLLIIGHGRHGKDTVADIISERYGLTKISSSMFAAERVVMPWLAKYRGLTYPSVEECYDDRVNHRQDWYLAISEYNQDDLARLASEVLETSDIYVGMRDDREFYASRHLFDYVVGVNAFARIPKADPTFLIDLSECDFVIENNGSRDCLEAEVVAYMETVVLA